jgi:hypothetical protein
MAQAAPDPVPYYCGANCPADHETYERRMIGFTFHQQMAGH